MEDDQQFCLRWNNHQSTLISVFDTLLEKGIHVDCTLAAEGQTLRAHKVVLSACSPYFENVLSQQYDKHPIIILKDVKYAELRAMMDYMYRGEVNISQDQLAALLKAAESLQIKGLSDNKPARPPNTHPPRSTTPVTKVRDGSVDSREGSTSPTRRRKKARRASTDGLTATTNSLPIPVATAPVAVPVPIPVPVAPAPPADEAAGGEPADCKVEEGSRGTDGEGVEDLTLDEENEEPPAIAQNDVVRNFQWHMERSQEEMMNTDGARDSQEPSKSSFLPHFDKAPMPLTRGLLRKLFTVKSESNVAKGDDKLKVKKIRKYKMKSVKAMKSAIMKAKKKRGRKKKLHALCSLKTDSSDIKTVNEEQHVSDSKEAVSADTKIHTCRICKLKRYKHKRNRLRHEKYECVTEPQFGCCLCDRRYSQKKTLKQHIENKHQNCF